MGKVIGRIGAGLDAMDPANAALLGYLVGIIAMYLVGTRRIATGRSFESSKPEAYSDAELRMAVSLGWLHDRVSILEGYHRPSIGKRGKRGRSA